MFIVFNSSRVHPAHLDRLEAIRLSDNEIQIKIQPLKEWAKKRNYSLPNLPNKKDKSWIKLGDDTLHWRLTLSQNREDHTAPILSWNLLQNIADSHRELRKYKAPYAGIVSCLDYHDLNQKTFRALVLEKELTETQSYYRHCLAHLFSIFPEETLSTNIREICYGDTILPNIPEGDIDRAIALAYGGITKTQQWSQPRPIKALEAAKTIVCHNPDQVPNYLQEFLT